jgi:ATP synthase protein I
MTARRGHIGNVSGTRGDSRLARAVGRKIDRRLKRRAAPANVLREFTLFGVIGWSVVVPVALFTYVGHWIDRVHGTRLALSFIIMGFVLGCYDAYYWLAREKKNLEEGDA